MTLPFRFGRWKVLERVIEVVLTVEDDCLTFFLLYVLCDRAKISNQARNDLKNLIVRQSATIGKN